jgi:hypothetical protein
MTATSGPSLKTEQGKENTMAMVEAMSQINDKPISQVTAFSHRFVRSAREGVAASFVSRTDDDTFAAKRLKAAQLPTVQSCQSGIFNELRHREDQRAAPVGTPRS